MIQEIIDTILIEIEILRQMSRHLLIAVDGRCAAGKTTFASHLQKACGCNVIPMDHFFLRPQQRTSERLAEPGGNVDYGRFLREVLLPIKQQKSLTYQPYDCHNMEMADAIRVESNPINVIEGSYSCHPLLLKLYDLRIFMTINEAEQMRRIKNRNGEEEAAAFKDQWIPLEESYFSAFSIKESCDYCIYSEQSRMFLTQLANL